MSGPAIVHVMGWRSRQYGSFERFLVALASRCAERGARTHLVFPAPPRSEAFVRDVPGDVHVLQGPIHAADPRFAQRFGALLRRARATHVHVHFGVDAYHAIAVAALLGVPARFATKHITPGVSRRTLSRTRHRWLAARVRRMYAVSNKVRDDLVRLGVPPRKVEVCYLGVDPRAYAVVPAVRDDIRRELGVAETTRVVLSTSHLRHGKGVEVLPRLAAELAEHGLDVAVVVAGDGPLRPQLEREAAARCLATEKFRLVGIRDDVPRLLAAADVFVFGASAAEGMGLAPLEALAAGVPVVATEVSDFPALLSDSAVLVPPGSPSALIAGCRRVLVEPAVAEELRRRGPELVARRFNVARAAETHARHYLG